MKKPRYLIMALACVSVSFLSAAPSDAAAIGKATYGLLSETYDGIDFNPNGATIDLGYLGAWPNPGFPTLLTDTSTFTEGGQSLKVVLPGNACGIYIQFGSTTTKQLATDMSAYEGGSLEFDVRSGSQIEIKLESDGGLWASRNLTDYITPDRMQWKHVSIPLSDFIGINLSLIKVPAGFHSAAGTTGSYSIDNIVWRKASGGAFNVTLRNTSDNTLASALTWSGINLGNTRWKEADQYLELDVTLSSTSITQDTRVWPYGVQIYTDNADVAAVPRYTGKGDPAGLVDVSTTTRTPLSMCWRIVDQTTTTHIMQGATGAPSRLWESQLTDQYPCYIWMRDKNSSDFTNGLPYVTAWDYRGIQHAEMTFGGARSPNYVYFGADFSYAIGGQRVYRTGRLIVELYNE